MDDDYPEPALSIGDLVRCVYELYHYYYPVHNPSIYAEEAIAKYGVITEIDYARFGDIFDSYEILYLVLCTDGIARYFSEYEVEKIS